MRKQTANLIKFYILEILAEKGALNSKELRAQLMGDYIYWIGRADLSSLLSSLIKENRIVSDRAIYYLAEDFTELIRESREKLKKRKAQEKELRFILS